MAEIRQKGINYTVADNVAIRHFITGFDYAGSLSCSLLVSCLSNCLDHFDFGAMNWLLLCSFTVLDNVSVIRSSVILQLHHQF